MCDVRLELLLRVGRGEGRGGGGAWEWARHEIVGDEGGGVRALFGLMIKRERDDAFALQRAIDGDEIRHAERDEREPARTFDERDEAHQGRVRRDVAIA